MSETAELADLVLPASLPFEFAGSFTNTQRVIQEFEPFLNPVLTSSIDQLISLLKEFGHNGIADSSDARAEAFRMISERQPDRQEFSCTTENNYNPRFNHGCDLIVKIFEDECIQNNR
jgi:anaerobic selenocysteine-containing dehydrogenase